EGGLYARRKPISNIFDIGCVAGSAGARQAGRPLLTAPFNRCYQWHQITERVIVMHIKFSEDVIPLSDLKINPGKVVSRAQDTHRPILLTSRGRGIAVVQGLEDYEKTAEELRFVK